MFPRLGLRTERDSNKITYGSVGPDGAQEIAFLIVSEVMLILSTCRSHFE